MAEQNPKSGPGQETPPTVSQRVAPSPVYKVDGSSGDYKFILRGADLVLVDSQNNEHIFMLVGNMMSMESDLRMEFSDGSVMTAQDLFERAEMPEMDRFDDEEALWVAARSEEEEDDQEGNAPEDVAPREEASPEQAAAEKPSPLTEAILQTQKNLNTGINNLNGENSRPAVDINTNTSRKNGEFDTQGEDNPPPEEKDEKKGESEDDKKADEKPDVLLQEPPTPGQSEKDNEFEDEGNQVEVLAKPFITLTNDTNSGDKTDTITNDLEPVYTGTAAPNSMVQLYVDGDFVKSIQASSDGNFTIIPEITYTGDGSHDVYVVTTRDGLTATSDTIVVEIDTTPPEAPAVDLLPESDTGFSASDNYTNDTTPALGGTGETPGTTITLFYQKYAPAGAPDPNSYLELGEAEVQEDGSWKYTVPNGNLTEDATYSFMATATDKAGNISGYDPAKALDGVVLDTQEPAAPNVVVTTDSTNTWNFDPSKTDYITNDNTPEFSGKTDADALIRMHVNGVLVGETTADAAGDWTLNSGDLDLTALTNTGELADGTYSVSTVAVDKAGNISPAFTFPLVIDTQKPTPTVEMADASDTGASNTDNITSNDVPFLEGTGEPNSHAVLQVTDPNNDTTTYEFTLNEGETSWTQQLSQLTVVGEYTASLVMEDEAGNISDPAVFTFTFDDTPPVPPTNLDLLADDTGISDTDNITSDRTPLFAGKAAPESTVTLYLTDENGNETTLETVADTDGNWTVQVIESLDAGTFTIEATSTNTAGLESARSAPLSPALVIDIDTAAPTIDLLTDSGLAGSDMTDHITNSPTPLFSGEAEKGSSVTVNVVDVNGNVVSSTTTTANDLGEWETTSLSAQLDSGTYSVRAVATDIAGNVSSETALSPNLVIDRDAPNAPTVDLAQGSDTGAFNSDNYTADTTPDLRGTAEPNSLVTITFIKDGNSVASYTAEADAVTGNWSFDGSEYTSALDNGTYIVSVTATDHADNTSAAGVLTPSLVIDTEAPPAPSLDLLTDSGTQDDWLTNVDDVRIGGTVDPTDIITLTITPEGGNASTYTISAGSSTGTFDENTGDWTYELESYPEGSYTIKALRTDLAGNQSIVATTETLVIDRSLDNLTINMVAEDDSGIKTDAEIITNDDNPRFTGTVDADSDIVVKIYAESAGTPGTYEAVPTDTYDLGRTTNTTWSLDGISPTINTLADGKYRVVVEATDDADNTAQATLDFEVDTQAPPASTIAMVSTDDTGFFDDDLYTKEQQPEFEGNCEPGTRVKLVLTTSADVEIETFTTTADQDGDWSWSSISTVLHSGDYILTAKVYDAADNESDAANLNFTVDTVAPAPPTDFQLVTDSGRQGDLITSDNPVDISGKAETGSRVSVYDGSTFLGMIQVADDGTWNTADLTDRDGNPVDMPLINADGDITYTFATTDKAGNVSETTSTFTFELDRNAELIDVRLKADHDTGDDNIAGSYTDGITKLDAPSIEVRGEENSTVVVQVYSDTDPDTPVKTETVTRASDADPNLYIANFSDLEDGTYKIKVTLTDAADNTTNNFSDPFILEVDTQPPAMSTVGMVSNETNDTGFSQTDAITSNQQPEFEGTCEEGALVELKITTPFSTDPIESAVRHADADGDWTWNDLSTMLDSGDYKLRVIVTDAAGNPSEEAVFDFTVDTEKPSPPTDFQLVTDSGEQGDLITSANPVDISGKAEAGSRVSVYDGSTFLGMVQVADDGTWNTADLTDRDGNPADMPLISADGDITYTFATTDKAGNVSETTSTFTFELDRGAELTDVALKAAHDTGSSDTDGITNLTSPKIEVRGEEDSTVVVQVYSGTTLVKTVNIDSASPSDPNLYTEELSDLGEGTYTVKVTLTDAAGNTTNNFADPFVLEVDTTAPTVANLDLTAHASIDTGVMGDHTTSNPAPTYSGKGEPGSRIELDVFDEDGNQLNTETYTCEIPENAAVDGNGLADWTINPQTMNLEDGTYTVKARAVDVAGNASPLASQEIVIDTVIAVPTIELDAASNSNFKDDNCTSNDTPTLKGTAEPHTALVLSIEGRPDVNLVADEHGGWSHPIPAGDPLGDDTYTVTITSTDAAGNSASRTLAPDLIIDTHGPNAPSVILNDTGTAGKANISDAITNDPDLSGTYDQNDTNRILIYLDGDTTAYEATLNPEGTWELNVGSHPTLASSITAGNHTYTVVARDLAGNESSTVSVPFEYDVANPAFDVALENAVTTPTVNNLTADASATIGGNCDEGLYFTITANGEQYEMPITNAGTWSFTFEDPDGVNEPNHDLQLVEGSNLVTIVAEDGAGNKSVQTITIILDTQAPEAPTMELADTYDTNIDGDNITNSDTLVLTGRTEPGSEIVLTLGGTTYDVTVDDQGNWTSEEIPNSAIADNDDYTFTARSVDATQNQSAPTSLTVTIDRDTTRPTVELHDTTNSGDKDDNVTNINNVLLNGTAEKGSTIRISVTDPDGITTILDTGQPVTADPDTGAWSFQTSGLGTEDGLYHVTVTATDVAGNQSAPSTDLSILIDTGMDVPSISLDPADDTHGRLGSDSDSITSGSDSNQLHLNGYTDSDTEVVEIYRGGEKIGEATIDSGTTDLDGNYRWTYTVEADSYADNTYTFTAVATDAAGNTASASLPITFDNTAPIKPSIDLHVDSDTGLSPTDEITNLNRDADGSDSIKLTGTVGEAGDGIGVFIYLNGGTNPIGQAVVTNRTWSFTYEADQFPDSVIPAGDYTFTAEVEDVAGNVSPASDPLLVKVDYSTVDPDINLVATSDSAGPTAIGGSVEDNITNKRFLDFDGDGAEPYAAVAVIIKDGSGNVTVLKETVADENGHWEVENVDTAGYAQGEHTFYARATDEAGNVSADVPLTVTLDTLDPVQTFPGLDADSDTGRLNTDDITMGDDTNTGVKTTHVTLRGELGEDAVNDEDADTLQVRVYEDMGTHTAYLGTAEIHSEGGVNYWTMEYDDITEGEHTFSIQVEDVAGNRTDSGEFKVVIDRTNAGTTLALDPSTNTAGNLGSDHDLLTSSNELLITGEAEGLAAVYITLNGNRVSAVNTGTDSALQDANGDWYVIADENGSWSIRVDAASYADNTYQFEVHTEDVAGNKQINPLSIEIDRTAPVAQNVDLAPASDLGRSTNDNITSANDIVLQGVLAPADVAATDDPDTVAVYVYEATGPTDDPSTLGLGGTLLNQAVVTGNSWTLPDFTPVEGDHYYYTRIVDNAGNESWSQDLLHVEIDHTLPVSSIDLDDGSDSHDTPAGGSITDNLTNALTLGLTINSASDTASIEIFKVVGEAYVSLGHANWNGSAWVFEVENSDIPSDGDYTFVSQATDVSGNVEDIPAANALTPADCLSVEIDRTPPAAPAIDLLGTDDSADANARLGSDHDEYTNSTSLQLNGTAETGAGDSVYLYVSIDGGAEILLETYDGAETTDGSWSHTYDSSALGLSGAQTLVFRAEAHDAADNISQTTLTVHVDRTLPDKPTIELGNPDPSSGSDAVYEAIVNEDTAELRGTLTEGAQDVIVTLYRVDENGDRTEVANSVADSSDLTITPDGNGNFTWAYDYTYGNDDGAFSFVAVVEDKAGNSNESDRYDILVDRSITPPTLDLTEGSDTFGTGTTGTNFDNRTNADEIDRITLTGTADTDCTVEIIAVAFNGNGIQEIVLATVDSIESNSTWRQENIDVSGLVDGEYTIIARATDKAGSVANSNDVAGINTVLNMTLDRLNETVTIRLDPDSDSAGHLGDPTPDDTDADGITNEQTITLRGDADLGTFVTVTDENNNQVGTASTDANGHWVITGIDTGTYGNGGEETITYTVSSVDTAGNRITQNVDVTFDKQNPSAPNIDLTDATNTGATNDGLTSSQPVTLTGTVQGEDAESVEIYMRNGSGDLVYEADASYNSDTNTWTYTTNLSEQDTPYTFVARAIDVAGNYTDSADFDVTIDRSVDAPTIKLDASTNSDGGPFGTESDDYTGYVAPHGTNLNLKVEGDTDGTIKVYHLHSNPGAQTFTVEDVGGVLHTYTGTYVGTSTYDPDTDEWSLVEFNASAYENATTDLNFVAVSTDLADNKAVREYSMTLDDEAPANGIIDLASGSDSFGPGGDNEDNRTNEKEITLTGTLTEGADAVSVTVFDNGVELGPASVSGDEVNGYKWTLVVGNEDGEEAEWISEQVHDFSAVVEDNAGNTTPLQHLEVTIDRSLAPPTFTLLTDSIGNEGQIGDRLTNHKQLSFSGTTEDDSTVEIYLGATRLGSAVMDPNGTSWTFNLDTESPEFADLFIQDKEYVLTAKATDTSGNTNSTDLPVTLDRTISSTIIDLADGSDSLFDTVEPHTGTDEDNITNETNLDLSGKIDGDSTIELYIGTTLLAQAGNGPNDITIDADGNWNVTVDVHTFVAPDTSETLTIRAEITDNAGNFITSEQPVTVDRATPAATTISLAPAGHPQGESDTGSDPDDNITQGNPLVLTGTVAEGSDAISVYIYDNGVYVGEADIAADKTWTFSYTPEEGDHTCTAGVVDLAGNENTSTSSLDVTVDRTFRTLTLNLADASDSAGVLGDAASHAGEDTDNITNADTVTFNGTTDAGATVVLTISGTGITREITAGDNGDGTGDWSITLSPEQSNSLQDTGYTASVTATDTAGNSLTETLPFTIDRDAPEAGIPSLTDDVDFGRDTDDNVTYATDLVLEGSLEEGASDVRVHVYRVDENGENVETLTSRTEAQGYLGEASVTSAGSDHSWTFTNDDLTGMADGTYYYQVVVEDTAGNRTASDVQTVVVNTDPPTVTINLQDDSDTAGQHIGSDTDEITNAENIILDGTTDQLTNKVFIYNGDTLVTEAVVSLVDGVITWETAPLPVADGQNETITYTARAENIAGKTTDAQLDVTLDRLAPAQPSVALEPDPNQSTFPDLTNEEVITLNITDVDGDPNAVSVTLFRGQGADPAEVGEAEWDADNGWTYTFNNTDGNALNDLGEGQQYFRVRVQDEAGNENWSDVINFEVDRTVAATTISLDSDSAGLHSGSATDGITNATILEFSGDTDLSGDSSVKVYLVNQNGSLSEIDGAITNPPLSNDGNDFTFTATEAATAGWDDGEYTFRAVTTDNAGNQSFAETTITLDRNIATPTFTLTSGAGSSDTGRDTADLVTSAGTAGDLLTFEGTSNEGDTVNVYITPENGTPALVGTFTADGPSWQYEIPADLVLTDNNYTFHVETEDKAGNSAGSTPVTVTIDRTTVAPTGIDLTSTSDTFYDEGGLTHGDDTDNTTRAETITLNGTVEEGSIVRLFIDGVDDPIATRTLAQGDSTWSITVPHDAIPTDAAYTFYVETEDLAGNVRTSDPAAGDNNITVTIDRAAPGRPSITINGTEGQDFHTITGAGDADGVYTSDTTPTFTIGNLEPGSRLDIRVDGVSVAQPVIPENTDSYPFTPDAFSSDTLPHTITVLAVDPAGNASEIGTSTFIVDTASETPADIGLTDATNAGSLADHITSDSDPDPNNPGQNMDIRPVLQGTAEGGAEISVIIRGIEGTTTADADGNWTYIVTKTQASGNGNYTAQVRATDYAGNESAPAAYQFEIDNTVDSTGFAMVQNEDNDTGFLPNDRDTQTRTPAFNWTAHEDLTATITVYKIEENGTETEIGPFTEIPSNTGQNSWSVPDGFALQDGEYRVEAVFTDTTANVSAMESVTLTVDNVGPELSMNLLEDAGAPDDWTTNGDAVNGNLQIGGSTEFGSRLYVYIDGVQVNADGDGYTEVTDPDGDWTFDLPASVLNRDDTYSIKVVSEDSAGNKTAVTESLTVDLSVSPRGDMVLADESNSGTLADQITNVRTPTLTGQTEPGSTVSLCWVEDVNGVDVEHWVNGNEENSSVTLASDGDGSWSITAETAANLGLPDVGETEVHFRAYITDDADNEAVIDRVVRIDNRPPNEANLTVSLTLDTDTGEVKTDGYTKNTTPNLKGGGAEADTTVEVYVDGDLLGTTQANGDGDWVLHWPNGTPALTEGDHTVTVRSYDVADNLSAHSAPMTVTIDTAADAPIIALAQGHDTGISSTDMITSMAMPTFSIQLESNSDSVFMTVIEVDADGHEVADGVKYTFSENEPPADGLWQPAIGGSDHPPLGTGTYQITVITNDKAGNSISSTRDLVIDKSVPSFNMVVAEDLNTSPHHGLYEDDVVDGVATHIINSSTATLLGSNGESGSVITVYDGDPDNGGTPVGNSVNVVDGNWSYVFNNMDTGTYTYTVRATDQVGNVFDREITYTVDLVDPTTPSITLAENNDSKGVYVGNAEDNITSVTDPELDITFEPDTQVEIFIGNALDPVVTITPDENTTGSCTFSPVDHMDNVSELTEGTHTYRVVSTDRAGNISEKTLTVDIDPAYTTNLTVDLHEDSDHGFETNDNITNDRTPTLTGNAEAGSIVKVYISTGQASQSDAEALDLADLTCVNTQTLDGDISTWEYTPTLAGANEEVDLFYKVIVISEDAAGNAPTTNPDLIIRLDTTPPAEPTVKFQETAEDGTESEDSMTADLTPILGGQLDADTQLSITMTHIGGEVVTFTNDDVNIAYDPDFGTMRWTLQIPEGDDQGQGAEPLLNGPYTVAVTCTDRAGNETTHEEELLVQAGDPEPPTIGLAETSDSNILLDGVTKYNGVTENEAGEAVPVVIQGYVESWKDVDIYQVDSEGNATKVDTVNAGGGGLWQWTIPGDGDGRVADGDYTYYVECTYRNGTTYRSGAITEMQGEVEVITGYRNFTVKVDSTPPPSDFELGEDPVTHESYDTGIDDDWLLPNENPGDLDFTMDDWQTYYSSPTIRGDAEPGSTVQVRMFNPDTAAWYDLSIIPPETDEDGNYFDADGNYIDDGAWSYTFNTLAEGEYRIKVITTDLAGNVSESGERVLTVDPNLIVPSIDLTDAEDTMVDPADIAALNVSQTVKDDVTAELDGFSTNSDGVTSVNNPLLTGEAEDGARVKVTAYFNGSNIPCAESEVFIVDGDTWSFQAGNLTNLGGNTVVRDGVLTDGSYLFKVTTVDTAGNKEVSSGLELTIDTETRSASIDMHQSSDHGPFGTSSIGYLSDNITKDSTPSFRLYGDNGATYLLFLDNVLIESGVFNGTFADFTYPPADRSDLPDVIADGDHVLKLITADQAGHVEESASLNFTIDATPVTVVDVPIEIVPDGGIQDDYITNVNNPTLRIQVEAGTWASISGGGFSGHWARDTDEDGYVEFTVDPALLDGSYPVSVRFSDTAGNYNPADTKTIDLVIDTQAPAAGLDMSTASDLGFSSGDNYTASNDVLLTGSIRTNLEDGAATALDDNENFTITFTNNTTNEVFTYNKNSNNGEFSYDNSTGQWSLQCDDLPNATYTVTTSVQDSAGNTTNRSMNFTVFDYDNIGGFPEPTLSLVDLPQYHVLLLQGSTVTSTLGSEARLEMTFHNADGSSLTVDPPPTAQTDGTILFNLLGTSYADYDYVTMVVHDRAGNVSETVSVDLDPSDSIIPPSSVQNTLSLEGQLDDSVDGVDDVDKVRLTLHGDTDGDGTDDVTMSRVVDVDANDNWSHDFIGELADGDYSLEITGIDTDNNNAEMNLTTADSYEFTLDVPEAEVLEHTVSMEDGQGTNPVLQGTIDTDVTPGVENVQLTVTPDGGTSDTVTASVDGTGAWSVDAGDLAAGDYTLNLEALDSSNDAVDLQGGQEYDFSVLSESIQEPTPAETDLFPEATTDTVSVTPPGGEDVGATTVNIEAATTTEYTPDL